MTREQLLKRYPHASEDFIRRNLGDDNHGGNLSGGKGVPSGDTLPNTEQRECPQELEADNAGEAPLSGCRHVRITLCRKKLLDVDAKYSSTKDLLDCLAGLRVISGDKEKEITLEVNQRTVEKGEEEKTIIEVFSRILK